ncbi:MAG: hypothetical protein MUP45_04520 [Candidatus Marinimicrobia bacterium]|nr:hypothetical protein [Candidatus Neomarinimicrobiota bacterium]
MKQGLLISIVVLCILVVIASFIGWHLAGYVMERDITGNLNRAQVASNAEDMYRFLTKLKTNMEFYGMTEGYTVLILPTPNNDMGEIYLAVVSSQERIGELLALDTSTETGKLTYDTRLDDVRGTLRELEIPALSFWRIHNILGWLMIVGGFISFLVGFWAAYLAFQARYSW